MYLHLRVVLDRKTDLSFSCLPSHFTFVFHNFFFDLCFRILFWNSSVVVRTWRVCWCYIYITICLTSFFFFNVCFFLPFLNFNINYLSCNRRIHNCEKRKRKSDYVLELKVRLSRPYNESFPVSNGCTSYVLLLILGVCAAMQFGVYQKLFAFIFR